ASLTYARVVAVGERHDEIMRRSGLASSDHLGLDIGLGAVGDIGADGVVEQNRVLRYEADRVAQTRDRYLGDVLPVDHDLAALGIEEAPSQIDARAFT